MSFIASPSQMKILAQAVDEYCRDCGITDGKERLLVAEMVSSLFDLGFVTLDDLRVRLDRALGPCKQFA